MSGVSFFGFCFVCFFDSHQRLNMSLNMVLYFSPRVSTGTKTHCWPGSLASVPGPGPPELLALQASGLRKAESKGLNEESGLTLLRVKSGGAEVAEAAAGGPRNSNGRSRRPQGGGRSPTTGGNRRGALYSLCVKPLSPPENNGFRFTSAFSITRDSLAARTRKHRAERILGNVVLRVGGRAGQDAQVDSDG